MFCGIPERMLSTLQHSYLIDLRLPGHKFGHIKVQCYHFGSQKNGNCLLSIEWVARILMHSGSSGSKCTWSAVILTEVFVLC